MTDFFRQMSAIELFLNVFVPALIGSLIGSWLVSRHNRLKEERNALRDQESRPENG
jgi:hypothetical protein